MLHWRMTKTKTAEGPEQQGAPSWQELLDHCRAYPDAVEEHPWGDTVFKVRGRIFAMTGRQGDRMSVTVKVAPELREILLASGDAFVPAYVGRFGWVGVRLADAQRWALAQDLIGESYAWYAQGRNRRTSPEA